jgi:antibiotic biosynthesis monooxygenase (ABM) superfamily enzyme
MSNKTRSILKAVAVLIVLLCVAMQLQWIIIPAISAYKFWLVVIAFGTLLIASK